MRGVLLIAAKDLRQRLRDRSGLIISFVAPLVIAGIMSVAFQGAEGFHATLGVADADGGPLAAALVEVLESPGLADLFTIEELGPDEAAAAVAVDDGDVDAAIVVPEGFSAAATGGGGAQLDVLTSVDSQLAGEVTRGVAGAFVAQVNANRLSVLAALEAGAPATELDRLIDAAAARRLPEQLVERPTGDEPLTAISYYAPAMALFFVFFSIGFGSGSFFAERRNATLDRLAAAPIAPAGVLIGKALSVAAYATGSLLTLLLLTSVVFGADWGHPAGAVALCLAMVVAVVALTGLVIAIARTERQSESISSMLVFGLALLGGNFMQQSEMPDGLRSLSQFTPNGQALRGFTDLSTGAPAWDAVAGPLAAILAFAVVAASAAIVLGRRLVVR